jgi:hypothetical protein
MYGFSIGIIFAPTLAAQEITPNGMRKGFTWVDAGTSIRPQTHAEKDCVNGSGSKGSIAGQRDLIQSQKFARRDTVREEREKPMIGQREPVFWKQEKRREEKRREEKRREEKRREEKRREEATHHSSSSSPRSIHACTINLFIKTIILPLSSPFEALVSDALNRLRLTCMYT